jgi:endonuclease YncB( thermonuclease family)
MSSRVRVGIVLLLAASVASGQPVLEGSVVGITDGDTLTLLVDRTQHKIRLAQIDTPERAQPWGNKAKRALSKKVHRKTVTVRVSDTDRYGRLIGEIWLGDRDINRELIREGYAWTYRDYLTDRTLLDDEAHAKNEGLGLWSDPNPVPPWRWRRGDRSSVASAPAKSSTCGSKTYCREMTSCDEAMFYLRECGLTRLDGDSDGVPCESIAPRA